MSVPRRPRHCPDDPVVLVPVPAQPAHRSPSPPSACSQAPRALRPKRTLRRVPTRGWSCPGPPRNAAPGQRQALATESTLFVSAPAEPWAVAEATARGARPLAKRPCSLLAKRACSLLAKQLCSPARGKALSGPTANARACGGGVCACSCAVPGASATDACASGSSTAHPGTDPDCSRASRTTSRPRATVPLSGNAIDPCTVSSVHLARIAAKLSPFITSQIPHCCGTCCPALRPACHSALRRPARRDASLWP